MAASTPARLKNLRNLLATKPHHDVLRQYLQSPNIGLLKEAILVTVHRVWATHSPHDLTELGLTTYDRKSVNEGEPPILGPHAEGLFTKTWSLHLRIRSHAHLPTGTGEACAFHFGNTVFVSREEALDLVHQIWHQWRDEERPKMGLRPIIYMHFGNNDGLGKMRKTHFDFDPSSLMTNVATLDAQIIPVQAKITRHDTASLDYLLKQFRITPFDVQNGGNAAMYTSIVAVLSTLRKELYMCADNPRVKAGQKGQSSLKSAQEVLQRLMEWPTPAPPFGLGTYCWRCGSGSHNFLECPNSDLVCSRCERSMHVWRRENANTHVEGLCAFR